MHLLLGDFLLAYHVWLLPLAARSLLHITGLAIRIFLRASHEDETVREGLPKLPKLYRRYCLL